MQILIFNSLTDAITALAEIDAEMGYPWVNDNALTGQPEPNREGTETWAIIKSVYKTVQQFYFISPEPEILSMISVSFTRAEYDRLTHDGPTPEGLYPTQITPIPGED